MTSLTKHIFCGCVARLNVILYGLSITAEISNSIRIYRIASLFLSFYPHKLRYRCEDKRHGYGSLKQQTKKRQAKKTQSIKGVWRRVGLHDMFKRTTCLSKRITTSFFITSVYITRGSHSLISLIDHIR